MMRALPPSAADRSYGPDSQRSLPHTVRYPYSPKSKLSRTFGRGGAGNILPPPPLPVSHSHHHSSNSPSLVTRLFGWIRSLRPRRLSSRRLSGQQRDPHPRDQRFLESLVRYTEDASYRSHTDSLASHRSRNEYTTHHHRVETPATHPTSANPSPRSPNRTRMSYIRSPHPPSSYHSSSHTSSSRPHPHANHPANSWYSEDTDDHSPNRDLGTNSRASDYGSLFYRPIIGMAPDPRSPTQRVPESARKRQPEPLKRTFSRPNPAPLQATPIVFSSRAWSPAAPRPPITLSLRSACGECEKLAFPTPPLYPQVIHKPKRSSGHWLAGRAVFAPPSNCTWDPQAYGNEEWKENTTESCDADSISSCQAAEDVELGSRSTSTTIFTHETVTTPTIDLPTPLTDTFGFGFSSASAHLWGRQAQFKHNFSLDESQSDQSQSDLSGNSLVHPGLLIDDEDEEDEDAEFVGELESVYSAFADVSTGSLGGAVRLSTVFGMDDIMSDAESVTDPHLHSVAVRIPPPRAWMGAA